MRLSTKANKYRHILKSPYSAPLIGKSLKFDDRPFDAAIDAVHC